MTRLLPDWLRSYPRDALRGDLSAGLIVAVMLVPQGMAYAMLAGLPPVVGLYASIAPLLAYAALGSSRQLAVGPVAMVSLLVAGAVGSIAEPGTAIYLGAALLLALMVGVIQFGMGLLRLGAVVRLLAHPVVSGFTSAAALVIAASQLESLLGIGLPRTDRLHELLIALLPRLGEVHIATLILGGLAVAALMAGRRWAPRAPLALVVVVGTTLAVVGLGLDVAVVGQVPGGLPSLTFPNLDSASIRALLPAALIISAIGFMESIAVANTLARRHGATVDSDRELLGLGAANLAAAFTGGYPVTGGFSRSAVNDQAGARTPLASVITAGLVGLTLILFTPLFRHLPKAALAAIIIVAVLGLVDFKEFKHLWHVKRSDAVLLALTFVATLTLGVEIGIGLGVLASLAVYLVRAGTPHMAVLGRLEDGEWRNVARFPGAEPMPDVLVVRVDSAVWVANVDFVRAALNRHLRAAPQTRRVVLDASGINALDSAGAAALEEQVLAWRANDLEVVLAQVKGPVRDVLERAGATERLGPTAFARSIDAALPVRQPRPACARLDGHPLSTGVRT